MDAWYLRVLLGSTILKMGDVLIFKKTFCLCFVLGLFLAHAGYAKEGYLWKVEVNDYTKLVNGNASTPEKREFYIGNKEFYLESIKVGKCLVGKADEFTLEMVELFEGHYGQRTVTCILPSGETGSVYTTSTIINCLTPYRRALVDSTVLDLTVMDKVKQKNKTLSQYKIIVRCPKFNRKFHKK